MKELRNKKGIKQITIIMVIIMLCNFIVPNYSYAAETENGGRLWKALAQLFCFIPDTVIEYLQNVFITTDYIDDTGEYLIFYSPGTIFAVEIPAFSINFIGKAQGPKNAIKNNVHTIAGTGTEWTLSNEDFKNNYSNNYTYIRDVMQELIENGKIRNNNSEVTVRLNGKGYSPLSNVTINHAGDQILLTDILNNLGIEMEEGFHYNVNQGHAYGNQFGYKDDINNERVSGGIGVQLTNVSIGEKLYEETYLWYEVFYASVGSSDETCRYSLIGEYGTIEDYVYNSMKVYTDIDNLKGASGDKEYPYTSTILQPIIATWYNALRRIALVGLLSVLVYLGIRIVLLSTSAKEKAKYKNMLKDWLVALCILFTLHYVMNVTITVVGKINEILVASVIGAEGEDILISTVRNNIARGNNWGEVLAYVAIYCVLGVYTVIFTIQYLRSVIYIAFLTMIAPLITLTYPLDKVKDKKAQAFDMWLKDYIFFSLIQVLHLLIYYIFLGSALDLANQGNWIFAIVAIGFMTKAEKIMKKMFGFEKSKTLGAMAAGATGALVMNAINKISHKPAKAGGAGGQASSGGGSPSSNVRTATTNPLAALSTGSVMSGANPSGGSMSGANLSGGSMSGDNPGEGTSSRSNRVGNSSNTSNSGGISSQGAGMSMGGNNTTLNTNGNSSGVVGTSSNIGTRTASTNSSGASGGNNKVKRRIKGALNLGNKYILKNLDKVGGAALGVLTGGTGAMIGFAAGVAQGDIGKAFAGAVAGGTAGGALGNRLGKGVVNLPKNTAEGVTTGWNNVKDTWNEGAYGEDYANNVKFDRAFRNSSAYSQLKRDSGFEDKVFDEKVSQMLDSGITDAKRMKKILKNHKKHPRKYRMDKAIAYSELAAKCPDGILYENSKFIRFCQNHKIQISEEELENLRKCIIDFK
ncbi:MAG: hypothetical protein IJ272_10690 [Clostridia bacterium]|nr:hypothetical protein [Clostridia bacterium]